MLAVYSQAPFTVRLFFFLSNLSPCKREIVSLQTPKKNYIEQHRNLTCVRCNFDIHLNFFFNPKQNTLLYNIIFFVNTHTPVSTKNIIRQSTCRYPLKRKKKKYFIIFKKKGLCFKKLSGLSHESHKGNLLNQNNRLGYIFFGVCNQSGERDGWPPQVTRVVKKKEHLVFELFDLLNYSFKQHSICYTISFEVLCIGLKLRPTKISFLSLFTRICGIQNDIIS